MNKRIALLPALFVALSSLVYTGCKDDEDTTPPVVTLNGDQNVTITYRELSPIRAQLLLMMKMDQ